MSHSFGAICDDFFVSVRLFLKLDLSMNRETVLHFFDRIRREHPTLTRLRRRSDGNLLLEENAEPGDSRRWLRLETGCLRFGHFNPADLKDVRRFGRLVLDQAPSHLTLGELDYDHLEVSFGFDLDYEGNHDQLVAETLFADHPMSGFLMGDEARKVIDVQPFWGICLTDGCDTQAYIELKSRTSTYEVRTGQYEVQPLSVYLTVRRYWGFSPAGSVEEVFEDLFDRAEELAASKAVPLVVAPLAHAIGSRS